MMAPQPDTPSGVADGIAIQTSSPSEQKSINVDSERGSIQLLKEFIFSEAQIERNLQLLFKPIARELRLSSLMPPKKLKTFARERFPCDELVSFQKTRKHFDEKERQLRASQPHLSITLTSQEHIQQMQERLKHVNVYDELASSEMFRS